MNVGADPRQEVRRADPDRWTDPPADDAGISRYLEPLRGRWWLLVATVIICLAVNLQMLSRAEKTYEATSYLIISPLSDREGNYAGLNVLRESNDPARNLETVAKVVKTSAVANKVKALTGSADSPHKLLARVKAVPVAGSDLLGITATSTSPRVAQQLANAFANATIQQRTGQLHAQVERLITELTPLVRRQRGARADPVDPAERLLPARLQQLRALRAGSDPTVRFEIPATRPRAPSSPKPMLSTAVSLVAGLLLGLGVVLGMQLIDPRVRSERHLRELYRLPVVVRVPEVRGLFGRTRPSAAIEARNSYQALRVALIGGGTHSEPGTVVLTGPSGRDGKTTTAIGLARALAQTGQRITLVEADARRPAIGRAMGMSASTGLRDVLTEVTPLRKALLQPPNEVATNFKLLLVDHQGAWLPDVLLPETAERLLGELEQTAEWIVIDCPPLGHVMDPLPLAILADQLLLVVRLGKSKVNDLKRLADVIDQHGIHATGFVLIGSKQPRYYG